MEFTLTEEQGLLRESVRRFVAESYEFTRRRTLLEVEPGFDAECWKKYAGFGWLGVAISESSGGLGGSIVDSALIMEEFGRGALLEPYLSSAVLGARLLASSRAALRDDLLPAIAEGRTKTAFAGNERKYRFDLSRADTRATKAARGFSITGRKVVVPDGASADWFLVTAASSGGIGIYALPSNAAGTTVKGYRTIDGRRAADVEFVESPAVEIHAPAAATAALDAALDAAITVMCAEAIGAMEAATRLAVDYIKVREQFGQPLAKFQVLQHRCADMFIETDQARSMVYQALGALDGPADERRWAVSACKVKVAEAGIRVCGDAAHLHGGNGMTDEFAVGHYLRRLILIEKTYGDTEFHVSRCIAARR